MKKINKEYLRYIELSRSEGLSSLRRNTWTLRGSFKSIAARAATTINLCIETNLDRYNGAIY